MRSQRIASWTLRIGLAGLLGFAGFGKLMGNADMVAMFDQIGLGQGFRGLTGGLEVAAAALLVLPATAAAGAVIAACVLIGAIVAHATVLGGSFVHAVVLLAAALAVVWLERETLRPRGRLMA